MAKSNVYKMFANPFYMGVMRWNGQNFQGSHLSMVTSDEFNHVQKLLGKKGHGKPVRKHFPYTGLIRCGECGCSITAEEKFKTIKNNGETKRYVYYHCTGKKLEAHCSQHQNIREEALEEQITSILGRYTILPQFREWGLSAIRESHEKEIKDRNLIYETQQREILATQNQIDGLLDLKLRSLINDEEYLNKKARLTTILQELKGSLQSTDKRSENWLELAEKAFDFVTHAYLAFQNGNLETRKSILIALGSNWTLKDGKLNIQAHSWLQLISNDYPPLDREFRRLEPTGTLVNKERTVSLEAVRITWLGR